MTKQEPPNPAFQVHDIVSYTGKRNIISTIEYSTYNKTELKWEYSLTGFEKPFAEDQLSVRKANTPEEVLPGTKVHTVLPFMHQRCLVDFQGSIEYITVDDGKTIYHIKGLMGKFSRQDFTTLEMYDAS